jgi:hypothetical protein
VVSLKPIRLLRSGIVSVALREADEYVPGTTSCRRCSRLLRDGMVSLYY